MPLSQTAEELTEMERDSPDGTLEHLSRPDLLLYKQTQESMAFSSSIDYWLILIWIDQGNND